jgi:hypothetical protein
MSEATTILPSQPHLSEWDRTVTTRIVRLNAGALGIVFGLLAGTVLFVLTNMLVLKGGAVVGPHLALLSQVFIGYRVTFWGSLLGFGYAAATGWAIGYSGATLYNYVAHHPAR